MEADLSFPGWGGGRTAIHPWMKFVALHLANGYLFPPQLSIGLRVKQWPTFY